MTKVKRDYLYASKQGWTEWRHKDYKRAKTNIAFLTRLALGLSVGIVFTFIWFS